ncbi:MAG: sodium/proline symporter [Cellvibrionales bacterium TMED49]|nr:sodium/proline symporter PutP [Porticoccaceae bacterium]OUU35103.1 MAG: sodium/proline symporter [Cellvibrionales bacterium TMED49]
MPQFVLSTSLAFLIYLCIVLGIGYYAYLKTSTAGDFLLGGRQLTPLVSAISAGASDMSGWVLLGLPGYAYVAGLEAFWISIGLVMGLAVNWFLVAKPLRIISFQLDDAVTIPTYLQRRFADTKPWVRVISSLSILLFFLFYVAAGLIAGGKLFTEVFGINYEMAVVFSVAVILVYTLFGGFLAVSWTDVFQGILILVALFMVPMLVFKKAGSYESFIDGISDKNIYLLNIFISTDGKELSFIAIVSALAWGLGYFGQPHILARFKAIRSPRHVYRAAFIGVVWAFLCYFLAIAVGLSGLFIIDQPLEDSEKVFIALTKIIFNPLVAGALLAAILAAIMSTVDSQLLVCSASLAEDLYPLVSERELASADRLKIARIAVVILALMGTSIAMNPESKVLDVVSYAWAGLGASLGPTIIVSLYWSRMTSTGAIFGVIVGGLTVIVWSRLSGGIFDFYSLLPGFFLSLIAIGVGSLLTQRKLSTRVVVSYSEIRKEF